MAEPQTVGVVGLGPDTQLRAILTEEKGASVLDLRMFDRFASVWMPSKKGLAIPLPHADAFADLVGQAAAGAKGGAA